MVHALALAALLVVLDDGEKIAQDKGHALPASPWPDPATISLFAMRGETIAVQAVVESTTPQKGVHATLLPFVNEKGTPLEARVDVFAEQFVHVLRPTGNDRIKGGLAFTEGAAPDPKEWNGWIADALVPIDADVAANERGAMWIDITVPVDAPPGAYASRMHVVSAEGAIAARDVWLRVLDREMPWAPQKTMIYYDPRNLSRRMGSLDAEVPLRQLMHAHHASMIRDVHDVTDMALDDRALAGELYTPESGYDGPGRGHGEGVFAIGAYGGLGAPTPESAKVAAGFAEHLRATGRMQDTQIFLYAIDEDCKSPWPAAWRELVAKDPATRDVRIGATCGSDPVDQRADLVMMTPADYAPSRARVAKQAEKWVWAYNGQRPYAGAMMLDLPAIDLRANAWIAARYGVERWFYWESTYWFDDIHGGRGGNDGFDPFVVAESFHNADGDHANGDGILVYPGTQTAAGMRDFGEATVFASIRLKNVRRGIEDAAYIDAARAVDAEAADEIVRRMVPTALADAGRRASWPDRGRAWLDARAELVEVLDGARSSSKPHARPRSLLAWMAFAAAAVALAFALRRSRRRPRP